MKNRVNALVLIAGIVSLVSVCLTGVNTVWADSTKTETGIVFQESEELVEPPVPSKPNPKPTGGNAGGKLPHMGQLVTSVILMLLGTACLIVFLGVISLRRIYQMNELGGKI